MSRKTIGALAVCAALAATGAAVAAHKRAQTTQQASATFAATTVSHAKHSSCTASDGAYTETDATYTGTATSGDARLAGPLVIRAHSVVDTTSGLGWVQGTFRIRGGDGHGNAHGTLHGAVAGGTVSGALVGETENAEGKLVATISAAFAPDAGFSSGTLGSGSVAGAGVVFQRGTCTKAARVRSVYVSRYTLKTEPGLPVVTRKGSGAGNLTFDVTRDSSGAIASAKAVFYANYRFAGGSENITGLTLRQGAKGETGDVVLDSGLATFTDDDGSGNVTQVVASVPASLVQSVLANPHGYYVELTASDTALRSQLGGFSRH
ncbi:MAG TPA: hypothetical protein VFJ91_04985 [Gaiellaceae bacterium]|nr:hypothetical protein [Gaiellaceae bacterium]